MFLRDTPGRTAMHREDFLSVAIASNDRPDFLHRVIDAVHRHADMPFEIVVADDAGHRRGDLSMFESFREKVSRLVINTGPNMGLAVNANQAIAATRGRNVVFLSDDSLVLGPFMRRVWETLEAAPYVGVLYLGQTYNPDSNPEEFRDIARKVGYLRVRTTNGHRLILHCQHDASWANAFRRSYWLEVGGYSEDDVYGDMPFINKGWLRGYFAAALGGPQLAADIDMSETAGTRTSMRSLAQSILCHYPKIFGLSPEAQLEMDSTRNAACSARNHEGRILPFNEMDCDSWRGYMRAVTETGALDWTLLGTRHGRFMQEVARDLEGA